MKPPAGLALLMPKPDAAPERDPMDAAASDLVECMKSGDVQGVKDALRAAWMAMEAEEPPTE